MTNKSLASLYKNLAELYDAGINIVTTFETLRSTERDAITKKQIDYILYALKKGKTLADSFKNSRFVPSFDIPVIQAGEQSGTLAKVFTSLSQKYDVRAHAEREIKSGLVKPGILLTVALFVPRFPLLFSGKITLHNYLMTSFGILGAALAITFLIFQINQKSTEDIGIARTRHNLLLMIPGLRGMVLKISMENFITTLAYMLEAGMPMFESLELAAKSSADDSIKMAVKRILHSIRSGGNLPQAFAKEPRFPHEITTAVTMGTQSGKLPALLQRQGLELNRQVAAKIDRFAKVIPVVIYMLVAIYVGKIVIGFYTDQMKGMDKLLDL